MRFSPGCKCCNTACASGNVCGIVTSDGCGGGGFAGATITVKNTATPPVTIGTCTTDATGKCCVAIPNRGTYTVTCAAGAETLSGSVDALCGQDNNVDFAFSANSLGTVCFQCNRCDCTGNNPASGVTISISGAGTASATTDSSGAACLRLGVGSYSATITYPSGFSHTQAFSVSACTTTNVSVTSSTGVYISARGQAGCSGSVTITDTTLSTTIGTGTITFDGTGNAAVCITITETLIGDLFVIKIVFPKFTDNGGSAPLACYTSASPYVIDYTGITLC